METTFDSLPQARPSEHDRHWAATAHLAALGPEDRRLYLLLAREALRLAREAGLSPEVAARMAAALDEPDSVG